MRIRLAVTTIAVWSGATVQAAAPFPHEVVAGVWEVDAAQTDETGVTTHLIQSEFQPGANALHVLVPGSLPAGVAAPVLYVLPVYGGAAAGRAGLDEVRRLGLHERFGLICVGPAFANVPWYADHPTDPGARQESHLIRAVLPFVEALYPVAKETNSRLLLGFSKSGWGAYSLLLRHPETFGRAASWDAPLALDGPGRWGTARVWITPENFARYQVTRLLRHQAERFQSGPARFVLLGHDKFPEHDVAVHELMAELNILHHWRHGPARGHRWDSGWVEPAVNLLLSSLPKKQS